MENKKKLLKRLKELEHQTKDATDEEMLKEAEELEQEMAEKHIEYDISPEFLKQILAKGKLLEAERALHEASMSENPSAEIVDTKPSKNHIKKKWYWRFTKKCKK